MVSFLLRLLLRPLLQPFARQARRSRVYWWLVILTAIAAGIFLLTASPDMLPDTLPEDLSLYRFVGFALTIAGVLMVGFIIWAEVTHHSAKEAQQARETRIRELKSSGLLLPIPPLPFGPPPATPEDLYVRERTLGIARLPWDTYPAISQSQAYPAFNVTLSRVLAADSERSTLDDALGIFLQMPQPLCFVGAAEVRHGLSRRRDGQYVVAGLHQGLRFIARAQYEDALQPDALVARVRLLADSGIESWLALADQSLAMLNRACPEHPRLPLAAAAIHLQRREYAQALSCLDALIVRPPTPPEREVAAREKQRLLLLLGHA